MARILAASVLLLVLAFAPTVRAQGLNWQPEWRRVGAIEGAITGTIAASGLVLYLSLRDPDEGWRRNLAIDTPLRNLLRAKTKSGRKAARVGSDVLLYTAALYPVVVEAGIVAWGHEQSSDVAGQMALVSLQSFATTQALVILSKKLVGRARPLVAGCASDPEYDPACASGDRFQSFFSGHTAVAFTGAGLVCVHQQHLRLYGEGSTANLPCYVALGAATMTALLRVRADRHHATDVLVGGLVGVLSGYLLPRLLYYRSADNATVTGGSLSREIPSLASPQIIGFGGRF